MGKACPDTTLDGTLERIAEATTLVVLTAEPANFAAIAALTLASVALTPGDGNGDFTIANGDTNGRKVSILQQTDMSISASGDADHVAYHDGVTLKAVTTCTTQGLTSGGTVTVPQHDFEIADPV